MYTVTSQRLESIENNLTSQTFQLIFSQISLVDSSEIIRSLCLVDNQTNGGIPNMGELEFGGGRRVEQIGLGCFGMFGCLAQVLAYVTQNELLTAPNT